MSTTTISHDAQMNDLYDMLFCGGGGRKALSFERQPAEMIKVDKLIIKHRCCSSKQACFVTIQLFSSSIRGGGVVLCHRRSHLLSYPSSSINHNAL